MKAADNINFLADFCGKRDIEELSPECLRDKYGINQADVMVLFGGSILCGGDVLADAIRKGVAKKYIIVGGAGHTTQTLRDKMHEAYPQIKTEGRPEAEIFNNYLEYKYSLKADFIETRSTNCGNNITFLLELLEENGIECNSVILSQDATMQRRMEAGLRKYRPDMLIINFATYKVRVNAMADELIYDSDVGGMWEIDRYITLLMGEIPRLSDNENGYGPKGKGYIAHVDVPQNVMEAFEELKMIYRDSVREANSEFASAK